MEKSSLIARALRKSLMVLAAFCIYSPAVMAQGTITIEQTNPIDQFAEWRLTTPSGTTVNRNKDQSKTVNADKGLYLLTVTPPEGAILTMKFYNDQGGLLETIEGNEISFIFPGTGALRAVLEMRYEGKVTVKSDPSGAAFALTGPNNVRYTGVTPATFSGFPPLYYTVSWSHYDTCTVPRAQHRTLRPNKSVDFMGDYTCENEIVTSSSSAASSSSSSKESEPVNNVRLWHTVHQTETIAGSIVRVTIGVRNMSKGTLRNIEVTEEFDPTALTLEQVPQGGAIAQGSTAVWKIPELFAGQVWAVTIPVRVNERLKEGEKIKLTARIAGDDLRTVHGDLLTSSRMIGVVAMPATGFNFDLVFALFSAIGAFTIVSLRNRGQQDVVFTA